MKHGGRVGMIEEDSHENIKHSKKNLANRCFNVSDNGNYERIIRKRKRKSSD